MTNTVTAISTITKKKTQVPAPFQFAARPITNKHKAQLTVDYGTVPGPHIIVGINDTAYGMGYLPKKGKK